MAIYIDDAIFKKGPSGRKSYCHMTADTLSELHLFASSIGVKPHFFHKKSKYPHYDLTAEQRDVAIGAGAQPVSSRELLGRAKAIQ